MVEAERLSKNYGPTIALSRASFEAEERRVLGFLGPNGAGKTTAMKILTTYILPTEGTARVGGHDVQEDPIAVRRMIGYLPETAPLYSEMTTEEYLRFVGAARGMAGARLRERMSWVVDATEIQTVFRRPVGELSRGFKQRVGLAQALIHDPQVLILDEPTSGLDPLQIIGIRKLIRKLSEEKTVIFSTHILQEASAISDRILIVNLGRVIAFGTPDELRRKATRRARIIVEAKADPEVARKAAEAVDVLAGARVDPADEEGWVRLEAHGESESDLTAAMDDLVRGRKWSIRRFEPVSLTLEEIFIELVRQADRSGKEAKAA
jgi:ABC-2 type transport system ATP-binding protein